MTRPIGTGRSRGGLAAGFALASILSGQALLGLLPPGSARNPGPVADPLERVFPALKQGARYVGSRRCLECHREPGTPDPRALHRRYEGAGEILLPARRGCEGCHGPGSLHAERAGGWITHPGHLRPMEQEALCTSCHAVTKRIVHAMDHFPGHRNQHVACLSCHRIHHPAGKRFLRKEPNRLCAGCHADVMAQFSLRSRHPLKVESVGPVFSNREGKVGCLDCHGLRPRLEDQQPAEIRREACLGCHPDVRGPWLFPHDAGGRELSDGCTTCHLPHGSPLRHLLRAHERGLCLSCHTDLVMGHFPGPSCATTACHTGVHGSNRSVFLLGR